MCVSVCVPNGRRSARFRLTSALPHARHHASPCRERVSVCMPRTGVTCNVLDTRRFTDDLICRTFIAEFMSVCALTYSTYTHSHMYPRDLKEHTRRRDALMVWWDRK